MVEMTALHPSADSLLEFQGVLVVCSTTARVVGAFVNESMKGKIISHITKQCIPYSLTFANVASMRKVFALGFGWDLDLMGNCGLPMML